MTRRMAPITCSLAIIGLCNRSNVSEQDIGRAFRKMALKHHPDKPNGSLELMKKINEANERAKGLLSKTKSGPIMMHCRECQSRGHFRVFSAFATNPNTAARSQAYTYRYQYAYPRKPDTPKTPSTIEEWIRVDEDFKAEIESLRLVYVASEKAFTDNLNSGNPHTFNRNSTRHISDREKLERKREQYAQFHERHLKWMEKYSKDEDEWWNSIRERHQNSVKQFCKAAVESQRRYERYAIERTRTGIMPIQGRLASAFWRMRYARYKREKETCESFEIRYQEYIQRKYPKSEDQSQPAR